MSGFENNIINALNALIRAAIHSPNFVTGVSGWSINKDGSAEFNNLTIRGTFQGTDWVINSSGLFMYDPTEALGNLAISITAKPVTGPLGESVPSGITVGKIANPQVNIKSSTPGGFGVLDFPLNNATIPGLSLINASIQSGPPSYGQLALFGPSTSGVGYTDLISIAWNSNNISGTSSANMSAGYFDGNAIFQNYLVMNSNGVTINASPLIKASQPGTGTSIINPAISEVWHSLGTLAGYTVGIGRYRLLPTNEAQLEISVTSAGANASSVTFQNAMPSQYRPLADKRRVLGAAGGTMGTVEPNVFIASATGNVSVGQNTNNALICYGDVTIPLD